MGVKDDDYPSGDDPHWENRKRGLLSPDQDNKKPRFRWWVIALFIVMLTVIALIIKPARATVHGELVLNQRVTISVAIACWDFKSADVLMRLAEVNLMAAMEAHVALMQHRMCGYGKVILTPVEIVGAYTDSHGTPWTVIRSIVHSMSRNEIFLMTFREIVVKPSEPNLEPTSFGERDA